MDDNGVPGCRGLSDGAALARSRIHCRMGRHGRTEQARNGQGGGNGP
ncbi:hypothetical protein OOZ51_02565 [Arthrobacter sp. MI7-26]|nr:hypothetical protein [Arthrobacter sp. MI7-26]MCX2746695.1 hypothetical protein [Arthrobacter sp. MI7-26]